MGGTIIRRSPVGWESKQASSMPPIITPETKAAMLRAAESRRAAKQNRADLEAYNAFSQIDFARIRKAQKPHMTGWLTIVRRVRRKLPKERQAHYTLLRSELARRLDILRREERFERIKKQEKHRKRNEAKAHQKFMASPDAVPTLLAMLQEKYRK